MEITLPVRAIAIGSNAILFPIETYNAGRQFASRLGPMLFGYGHGLAR